MYSVQDAVSNGAWTYARNAPAEEREDGPSPRFQPVAPGAEFLFDRQIDPGENVNLVSREAAAAGMMRQLLDRHLAEGDAGIVEQGVRIDPAIADRLRAMGYLR
jgi:hypothetical protein